MKNSLISLLSLSLIALSISSCKMMENAETAAENSGKAATAASESREEIANGRIMSRSGSASLSRNEYMKELKAAVSFEGKTVQAAKYLKAFEYQLWTGQKYDTPELLDRLLAEGVSEFFRAVKEVNGGKDIHKTELSPFKIKKKEKDINYNLYALAVSMHSDHILQDMIVRSKTGAAANMTMYSLIKETLRKIEDVESDRMYFDELKDYEKKIYNRKKDAIALIQARFNMLLTMAISKLSDITDSKVEALKLLYVQKSFVSNYSTMNMGEQYETNRYLDAARKVKVFLDEMGIEAKVHKRVTKLYEKMVLPDMSDDRMSVMSVNKSAILENHRNQLEALFDRDGNRLKRK